MKIRNGKDSSAEPSSDEGQYYEFKMEPFHVQKAKRGQKIYVCDLCQGAFKRSFSLKRHYLRFHINYAYLSPRDLNNCAIVLGDKQLPLLESSMTRKPGCFPKLYRCHHCGFLVDTKEDLTLHLDAHPVQEELVRGSNRCPRCSTAFSLRKTLRRHIKKNRCRGATKESPAQTTEPPQGETVEQNDPETEDTEEIDMEVSLLLGCSTAHFRYACTLCSKMFSSYVNMCRHRSLAHGGYGICSPHFLASRKVKHAPLYRFSPVKSSVSLAKATNESNIWAELAKNVKDNVEVYVDGRVHFCLPEPQDATVDAGEPQWTWTSSSYNLEDVARLDIPVQQAFQRSLTLWNQTENKTSQKSSANDLFSTLSLVPRVSSSEAAVDAREPLEFSGEWTRPKNYICLVCSAAFEGNTELEDHQSTQHSSVWCSHFEVDASAENIPPLLRYSHSSLGTQEIFESSANISRCTKCSYEAQSAEDLHSHVLDCSNPVVPSPARKKRTNRVSSSGSKGKKWRAAPRGRSRGMKRSLNSTSQMKNLRSRTNEVIPDPAMRRSTRRVLNFAELTPGSKASPRKIARSTSAPVISTSSTTQSSKVPQSKSKKPEVTKTKPQPPTVSTNASLENKSKKSISDVTAKSNTRKQLPDTTKPTNKSKANQKTAEQTKPDGNLKCTYCKREFFRSTTLTKHEEVCTSRHPLVIVCDMSASDEPSTSSSQSNNRKNSPKKETAPKTPLTVRTTPCAKKRKAEEGPDKNRSTVQNEALRGMKDNFTASVKRSPSEKTLMQESEEKPSRPVRSSRKSSLLWSMNCSNDEIEPSFLEALSPQQKARVAEQKCPFCTKHYVYKSNFKKHLLEGCDTIDEPSEQKTPLKANAGQQPKKLAEDNKATGPKKTAKKEEKAETQATAAKRKGPSDTKVAGEGYSGSKSAAGKRGRKRKAEFSPNHPKTPNSNDLTDKLKDSSEDRKQSVSPTTSKTPRRASMDRKVKIAAKERIVADVCAASTSKQREQGKREVAAAANKRKGKGSVKETGRPGPGRPKKKQKTTAEQVTDDSSAAEGKVAISLDREDVSEVLETSIKKSNLANGPTEKTENPGTIVLEALGSGGPGTVKSEGLVDIAKILEDSGAPGTSTSTADSSEVNEAIQEVPEASMENSTAANDPGEEKATPGTRVLKDSAPGETGTAKSDGLVGTAKVLKVSGAPESSTSTTGSSEASEAAPGVTETSTTTAGSSEVSESVPGVPETSTSTANASEVREAAPGVPETSTSTAASSEVSESVPGVPETSTSTTNASEVREAAPGVPETSTSTAASSEVSETVPSVPGSCSPTDDSLKSSEAAPGVPETSTADSLEVSGGVPGSSSESSQGSPVEVNNSKLELNQTTTKLEPTAEDLAEDATNPTEVPEPPEISKRVQIYSTDVPETCKEDSKKVLESVPSSVKPQVALLEDSVHDEENPAKGTEASGTSVLVDTIVVKQEEQTNEVPEPAEVSTEILLESHGTELEAAPSPPTVGNSSSKILQNPVDNFSVEDCVTEGLGVLDNKEVVREVQEVPEISDEASLEATQSLADSNIASSNFADGSVKDVDVPEASETSTSSRASSGSRAANLEDTGKVPTANMELPEALGVLDIQEEVKNVPEVPEVSNETSLEAIQSPADSNIASSSFADGSVKDTSVPEASGTSTSPGTSSASHEINLEDTGKDPAADIKVSEALGVLDNQEEVKDVPEVSEVSNETSLEAIQSLADSNIASSSFADDSVKDTDVPEAPGTSSLPGTSSASHETNVEDTRKESTVNIEVPEVPGSSGTSSPGSETKPEAFTPVAQSDLPAADSMEASKSSKEDPRASKSQDLHAGLSCPVCGSKVDTNDVLELNEHIRKHHMDLKESQIPLQSQMSLALNGLLEKALDSALESGFLKPYSAVTKLPKKIRKLQIVALNYRSRINQTTAHKH